MKRILIVVTILVLAARSTPAQTPSSGAVARGCSTIFYIDWDCDGYGPGVRASGTYPIVGFYATVGILGDRPDADDTSASLNTAASVLAAYDANSNSTLDNAELKTFLAQRRGY